MFHVKQKPGVFLIMNIFQTFYKYFSYYFFVFPSDSWLLDSGFCPFFSPSRNSAISRLSVKSIITLPRLLYFPLCVLWRVLSGLIPAQLLAFPA